jgi:serine/threonine protein kinase
LLHLDVKPANVMHLDGRSVLFDFSVAKYYSPEYPLKDDAGTVEYMAPRQTNYEEVSYATDVFGLGILFYQLLRGGALPYPETTRRTTESGQSIRALDYKEAPPNPSNLNPEIPRCIADVAMTAIQPKPSSRYATALDLKGALLAAIEQAEAALQAPELAMAPETVVLSEAKNPVPSSRTIPRQRKTD